jgi:thioesterase domain-containing protein
MERKLQETLDSAIPLTQAMGIIVERYTRRELTIIAPLANNFNHLGTAFGGSLYIACVLSAWGLLYLRLREAGVEGNIVIRKGNVEYLRPVTGDITATGALPPEEEVAAVIESFRQGENDDSRRHRGGGQGRGEVRGEVRGGAVRSDLWDEWDGGRMMGLGRVLYIACNTPAISK